MVNIMASKLTTRSLLLLMNEHKPLRKCSRLQLSIARCVHADNLIPRSGEDKCVRLLSLGNGTNGTPRSISLTLSVENRILINCGEGTVKAMKERKQRLGKAISTVFITHKDWANISGMRDLMLTSCRRKLYLYGPPGIEKLVDVRDENIFAHKIRIVKKEYYEPYENAFKGHTFRSIPLCKHQADLTAESKLSRKFTKDDDIALAYVFKRDPIPPVVIRENCFAYGPEIIPLLQNLKNGRCVTLSDGRLVEPKDVLMYYPRIQFIVLDCPNEDYLDSLLNSSAFPHCEKDNRNDYIDAIIHLTPSSVMKHPKYKEWIQRFPACTKQVIINDSFNGWCERKMHRYQRFLHKFDPDVFPLLHKIEMPSYPKVDISNGVLLVPSKELFFKPEKERNVCEIQDFTEDYAKENFNLDQEKILNEWQQQSISSANNKNLAKLSISAQYPEIIFLGTSSSVSSAVRNVSGILVHLSNDQCILLDCGTGILNQLINFYGSVEANNILEKLRAVFISHLHADHYLGLHTLLLERNKLARTKKLQTLSLIAPPALRPAIYLHDTIKYIPFQSVKYGGQSNVGLLNLIQTISQLHVVPVKHYLHAHAIIITDNSGFKLVYSGDTAPCKELISAGENCDLLIHEATHPDGSEHFASQTYHCTTSQAIDVSHQMKAKHTILTHFGKTLEIRDSLLKIEDKQVALAFDFLRVTPQNLYLLPLITQMAFKATYARTLKEDEDENENEIISVV